MKFKRILCGVDFSQASVKAFETALELVRPFKAELHVMHFIEAEPATPDLTFQEKAVAAMDTLVSSVARDDRNLQITTEVTIGGDSDDLLNRAREPTVDLIVLGAKGCTLLGERVFCETAKRV